MTVNIEGLGKITASKETLNMLHVAFFEHAELAANNRKALQALVADERSTAIFKALDSVGYYDGVE